MVTYRGGRSSLKPARGEDSLYTATCWYEAPLPPFPEQTLSTEPHKKVISAFCLAWRGGAALWQDDGTDGVDVREQEGVANRWPRHSIPGLGDVSDEDQNLRLYVCRAMPDEVPFSDKEDSAKIEQCEVGLQRGGVTVPV